MSRRVVILLLAVGALALAGAAALLASGGGSGRLAAPEAGRYRGSEPPGVNLLPRFSLPRVGGGVVRSDSLRGKVVLVTFVDSACKETCPIIVSLLGRTLPRLSSERSDVVALAISVDPPADTAAHVRRFLRERRALGQLDYLVAPVRAMTPIWKSFHVLAAAESGDVNIHSSDVRIFDRRGRWVSNLNVGADLSAANLLHDLRLAIRAKG